MAGAERLGRVMSSAGRLVHELKTLQEVLHDGYQGRGDVRGARVRVEGCLLPEAERLFRELRVLHLKDGAGLAWDTPIGVVADCYEERGDLKSVEFLRAVAAEEKGDATHTSSTA